jgi:hypothetical protein
MPVLAHLSKFRQMRSDFSLNRELPLRIQYSGQAARTECRKALRKRIQVGEAVSNEGQRDSVSITA